MPLWSVYHSANAFSSDAERDEFAKAITDTYAQLPPFYVVVTFLPLQEGYLYRSGKRITSHDTPFVRLVIHHLARHASDNPAGLMDGYAHARGVVDKAIRKHVIDKGYKYEYTILEDSRDLWKIDGFVPPPFQSEAMRKWRDEDQAGPYL